MLFVAARVFGMLVVLAIVAGCIAYTGERYKYYHTKY
jgi:hypothetical protein